MKERKPGGWWKDWNNVEAALKELMKSNHGLIPSQSEFSRRGLSGLSVSLQTYWGGLQTVREKLGCANLKFCKECQTTKAITEFRIKNHPKGSHRNSVCTSCSSKAVGSYRETWPGRAADMYRRAAERAKKANRVCTISKEWVFQRLASNNFCCELTGLPFQKPKGHWSPFSASLDRIDSSKGYTPENTRVICQQLNIGLGNLGTETFYVLAEAFVNRYQKSL